MERRAKSNEEILFIAESCPDVLWSYKLEQQRWCYISPSVERLSGYSAEEALEMTMEQLMVPSSYLIFSEQVAKRLELFLADESHPHMNRDEVEVVCKDGSTLWCEITSQCFRNEQGELTLTGVARDIKDRSLIEKELRASEEKYREILSSIEEGYYEVDLDGNLVFFNDAACRMLGFSRAEFTGIDHKILCKEMTDINDRFDLVYQTGQPESGFTMQMLHRDGSIIYVEISISPIRNRDGIVTGFRGVARNITERIKFQQQLEYFSMHDQLTGLYNRTYFEEEMRRLSKSRDYPITMISADVNGLKLINDSLGHDHGDRLIKAAADVLQDSLRGSDVLARVGGDEFSAILVNTNEKIAEKVMGRMRKNIEAYCDANPGQYLSISLGVATAEDSSVSFTELFKQADDAMYQDKFRPTKTTRNKILKSLMDALAEKDFLTDGHAKRLAIMCRKVGNELGLSSRQQADLALLAQVHDLGKVGIPDKIIFKKGPLNEDEWRIMKQHPEKGHRIALSSNYLTGVANLILKHHERWDGKGYPLCLKGREIPVECRILNIVDAYDTMTNVRPYSMAKSKEEALDELVLCSGKQFDPDLVDCFAGVLKRL